jgi:hypothetical protein
MSRELKFKLSDTTLTSDVNQTLSNLLSQVNKTNNNVGNLSARVSGIGSAPPYVPKLAVGANVSELPWNSFNRGSGTTLPTAGYTYCQVMYGDSIIGTPPATAWRVSLNVTTVLSAAIVEMCVIRTLKGSLTTVDVTPITFGGSATPLFATTGVQISDAMSLVIDPAHDYYFCFTGNAFGGSGNIAANDQSSNPTYTSYAGNVNSATPRSSAWVSSIPAIGTAFPLGFGSYFLCGWVAA